MGLLCTIVMYDKVQKGMHMLLHSSWAMLENNIQEEGECYVIVLLLNIIQYRVWEPIIIVVFTQLNLALPS